MGSNAASLTFWFLHCVLYVSMFNGCTIDVAMPTDLKLGGGAYLTVLRVNSDSVPRDHSWKDLEDHMQCLGLNLGRSHARPVHYLHY